MISQMAAILQWKMQETIYYFWFYWVGPVQAFINHFFFWLQFHLFYLNWLCVLHSSVGKGMFVLAVCILNRACVCVYVHMKHIRKSYKNCACVCVCCVCWREPVLPAREKHLHTALQSQKRLWRSAACTKKKTNRQIARRCCEIRPLCVWLLLVHVFFSV